MATLALAGLGAALGSLPGGLTVLQGLQLGAAIGGYIDQQNAIPNVVVGKLNDLKVSSSAYGTMLPWVWGTVTLPGIFFWAAVDANGNHLKETKTSKRVGGKGIGGGSQTTYTYSSTFAVAACESSIFCPDPSRADGGTFAFRSPTLKKIKADDIVIYDSSASSNVVAPSWRNGSETQSVDSTIASLEPNSPAYRGLAYFVLTDLQLKDFSNRIPNFTVDVATTPVTVGDILSDIFQAVGILPSQFDVSAATASVPGFAVLNRGALTDAVGQLLTAYALDLVEVDGKIVAVARGGSAVATIPAGDLASTTGGGSSSTLPRVRAMRSELPGRVDVGFYDSGNLNQAGLQSDVRQSGDVTNIQTYQFSLFTDGATMRNLAGRLLDTMYLEADGFNFQLPPNYLYLAPADVVNIPTNQGNVRVRITKMDLSPLGSIAVTAVPDGVSILTQSLPGGSSSTQTPATYTVTPTTFVAWSGREIIDAHQSSAGFYVAAAGPSGWSGCSVYYSTDSGSTWILGPDISRVAAFGTATISNYGGAAGTMGGSATVNVTLDAQTILSSCAAAELSQGLNWAYIGGEIVAIQNYNLTGTRTYSASNILRGLRSTTMSGHGSNELFVELTSDVQRVPVDSSFVGSTILVKCVSRFQDISAVTAKSVVIAARTPTAVETTLSGITSAKPANTVYSGPTSGVDAVPTFRTLVQNDIPLNCIDNTRLSTMATALFKGRKTAGTGNVEDLTGTQATSLLDTFTSSLKGLVPASGGGTTTFLRADGTFATPPSGSPAGSTGQIQYNNAGAFGASAGFTYGAGGLAVDGPVVANAAANGVTGASLQTSANGATALVQRGHGNVRINYHSATAVFWTAANGTVSGADTGGYTDATAAYNGGPFNVFNGGAALKRVYIGYYDGLPNGIGFYFGVGGTTGATGTVVWERWNGSSWTTFTGSNLTGGAEGWMNPQGTAARSTINGVSAYWIRGTVSTAYTTAPIYRLSMMQQGYFNPATPDLSAGLFLGKSNLPSGTLANMAQMGVLSLVVPGNGEQNIFTAYSEYTGSLIYGLGGDGSVSAPNTDNLWRTARFVGGGSNNIGVLQLNQTLTGYSGSQNFALGMNNYSGWTGSLLVVQRNGTKYIDWRENGELQLTGGVIVTQPANRSASGTSATSGTAVTGTSTIFTKEVSVDDWVAFSSAPSTFYRVTAVGSDTSLTLATSPGTLSAQTVTIRKPLQRYVDNSGTTRFLQRFDGSTVVTGTIQTSGIIEPIVAKTANYTVTLNDFTILCSTATAGFTVTLPDAATCSGQIFVIKKTSTDANTLSIAAQVGQSIDGATPVTTALTTKPAFRVQSDGANWWLI